MSDSSGSRPTEDRPTNRRRFFREGLASLLSPLAEMLEGKLDRIREAMALPELPGALLRPPGALPEEQFRAACQSCGKCAAACPVTAIFLDAEGGSAARPLIDARRQPCVLCDSLACMAACPSGALARTRIDKIDMGRAVLDADSCRRTRGDECHLCLDCCPRGTQAIRPGEPAREGEMAPVVVEDGCVGCGSCEFYCPANPRAITVQPHR